jgi:hypothetical protein
MIVSAIEDAGERRAGESQRAETTRRDQRLDRHRPGMKGRHVGLAQRDPGVLARRRHRLGVGGRGRERLLAEHVLASRGGAHDPLAVQAVRQRHVDRLDLGIVEHGLVGSVGPQGLEGAGSTVGAAQAPDRDQARPGARDDRRQHRLASDLRRGADHAPADRHVSSRRPRARWAHPRGYSIAARPRARR